ncbi:MAG: hypothetical protein Q8O14_10790 [bacterium]|jgi:hypothetical protein|nr:hypothetical protein [bacterium]
MRTEQAGQTLLKAYQDNMAQRQAERPGRPAAELRGTSSTPETEAGVEEPRQPRELGKGRLLDIYG